MQNDNLTSGPMATHFKTLAVPAAFGMLFTTLYNVVDVYFAGLISTDAQAGMAIGFQAFFILMAFGFGLGSGLSALVSNAKGAEDTGSTKSFAAQGLSYGAIATLVLMAVGVLSGPWLIQLISEPGSYRIAATGYFHWLIFALPGFLLAYASNGILQAHGDSKSMQRAMMAAFFANIGLNPLLMFGIPGLWGGMGFNGIAVATILSQTGVMAFLIWRVFQLDMFDRITKVDFVPKWDAIKSITVQMLPTGTAMLVMFTSGFVVQYFLKAFGPEAIAAYGVALRIEQILLLPILGMTGALLPIAGQNFGAKDYDRVRAAVRFCWQLGFLMCLIACPILLFGGHIAMSLFTDDPAVITIGASYLQVDAFLFPLYMMLFSLNSLLQALKQPIWTLWISIYRQGFGVAFFIWLLIGVFGFGVTGVWLGIALAVSTGWIIALVLAARVARREIGGLRLGPVS